MPTLFGQAGIWSPTPTPYNVDCLLDKNRQNLRLPSRQPAVLLPSHIWRSSSTMQTTLHLVGKREGRSPVVASAAGRNKPKTLVWNEAVVKAFQDTKKVLAEATLLTHPRHNTSTSLTSYASDQAVGAIITVRERCLDTPSRL